MLPHLVCQTQPNHLFYLLIRKGASLHGFVCQTHGDKLWPVAYFSTILDPVAAGLLLCLRAVSAAEKTITLMVTHAVAHILQIQKEKKKSHLLAQQWLKYHITLLDMPNVYSLPYRRWWWSSRLEVTYLSILPSLIWPLWVISNKIQSDSGPMLVNAAVPEMSIWVLIASTIAPTIHRVVEL